MANQDPNQANKKPDGSPKGDNRQAGDVDGNSGAKTDTVKPGTGQTGGHGPVNEGGGQQRDGAKGGSN